MRKRNTEKATPSRAKTRRTMCLEEGIMGLEEDTDLTPRRSKLYNAEKCRLYVYLEYIRRRCGSSISLDIIKLGYDLKASRRPGYILPTDIVISSLIS
jgi:hypothetical protein